MDLFLLKDFFTSYSLITVLIATVSAVVSLVINYLFKDKLPRVISAFLPFILAIICYFIYEFVIISEQFLLNEKCFYTAVMCGSLSTVIISIINKIRSGKPLSLSPTLLLIESLLSEFVDQKILSATAIEIEQMINEHIEDETFSLRDKILSKIKKVSPSLTVTEARFAATVLIEAVKTLKDEDFSTDKKQK
jgi:hypothetical protein